MTLEEYNNSLRDLGERTGERLTERVMVVSATRMLASMQNRVFRDGLDSNRNKIGIYSTTPYYASKDQFVRKSAFTPMGKAGVAGNIRIKYTDLATRKTKTKVVKANGEDRKTMYLKDGYKQFRDVQGRPTSEVNLHMRGDLKLSLSLQTKDKEVVIGFNNEQQALKRKWLEQHFKNATGTIFPATTEEKEEYSKEVINELRLVEREIMEGI